MYQKIRFCNKTEATAGIVIDLDKHDTGNIVAMSRMFPYSEANKMKYYERSPIFENITDAFGYSFDQTQEA